MQPAEPSWVIDVDEANFEREVLERSRTVPVVVDFWAPWCGPCRALGPMLEALAHEKAGAFVLAKLNVDENQELAGMFRIEGIPAVIAFRDGRPALHFVGLLPEEQLRQFIDQVCPSEADQGATRAADLEANSPAEAEAQYRKILAEDPNHEAARIGLARVLVAAQRDAEAAELLKSLGVAGEVGEEAERLRRVLEVRRNQPREGAEAELRNKIEADPENAQLRYELGSALASAGRYPEALEVLLSAAERDRQLARNQVRELMVKIFEIIGMRSPMADEYRDKLRGLLY